VTACGSVQWAKLRLANADDPGTAGNEIRQFHERYEITSLVGTICADGQHHLHMGLGDKRGVGVGGHLLEATIFTTCEIVLGECSDLEFVRKHDSRTKFDELMIVRRRSRRTPSGGAGELARSFVGAAAAKMLEMLAAPLPTWVFALSCGLVGLGVVIADVQLQRLMGQFRHRLGTLCSLRGKPGS